MTDSLIEKTKGYVQAKLEGAEAGHDWFHVLRVYANALAIAEKEQVDTLVVQLAALLHDIADSKFHNGDETIGPKLATTFLESEKVPQETITHVVHIIQHLSFKNSFDKIKPSFSSKELFVVRDADRLDAMGAIGIARAFHYGGYKNRELYNPEIPPKLDMTKEEYKASKAPTINHFYEKLLRIKDRIHTQTGKQMAEERHEFMLQYLQQFYREWGA